MRQFTWTIKASKFCNMRCHYCYEWPGLADAARISLTDWKRIVAAAREYHWRQTRGEISTGLTRYVWHGGEPLSLPVTYWREVIGMQREILRDGATQPLPYRNDVQTNLFALTPAHLDLFEEEVTMVNVSFDGAPGTRVTKQGRRTEDRVIENMERLRERNIRFGVNVVLGGHTKDSLIETYELLKTSGASQMSVIPMIAADHFSNDDPFAISSPEVVTALAKLFLHWTSDPEPLTVIPLNHYLRTVRLHRLNLRSVDFDRSDDALRRFIVDTGGDLYVRVQRAGKQRRLGNLFIHSLSEIFQSEDCAAALEWDTRRRALVCDSCAFREACDTHPSLESNGTDGQGRCPVAAPLCDFILEDVPNETRSDLALGNRLVATGGATFVAGGYL